MAGSYAWHEKSDTEVSMLHNDNRNIIIILIMEAFIKRRIPGKTTCSKALQYNSNKVVIKLKLY